MIAPKVKKPSPAAERAAYRLATERDDDTCQRCLRDCGLGVTSRDHRKGRGVGGLTVASNLQVLGGTGTTGCHGWKGANPALALLEGWSVPGWADPLVWPARRWHRQPSGLLKLIWVLYRNDGTFDRISDAEAARRIDGQVA